VSPESDNPAAPPDLHVKTDRGNHRLPAGTAHRVGRNPNGAIVLDFGGVSWEHGELSWNGTAWTYTDLGSKWGSYVGADRVEKPVDITAELTIRLGHARGGSALACVPRHKQHEPARPEPDGAGGPASRLPGAAGVPVGARLPDTGVPGTGDGRGPTSVTALPLGKVVRIGRDESNDRVLHGDLLVSRKHAELRRTRDGFEIRDVGSQNGVFVNGVRVASRAVTEGDRIRIGRSVFYLANGELAEYVDAGAALEARQLVVRKGGKVLLDHVSFTIPRKCLLAVLGGSGAGKSTLVGTLTGARPADGGTVVYNESDLYANYEELRSQIGYVPQSDILHTQLRVRQALRYAAELRSSSDTPAADRNDRIGEVLRELKLAEHADKLVKDLSGGQRKRVNVAQELLNRPSLLVLDEPTSGLDPGLDGEIMQQLRTLAHDGRDGRTIIVVTHSVLHLEECDRLLVLVAGTDKSPGGKVAYYGPPDDALRYFGKDNWTAVFQSLDKHKDHDWAGQFQRSPYAQAVAPPASAAGPRKQSAWDSVRVAVPRGWRRQTVTLTRRYARVTMTDRGYLLFMVALPVIVGLLVRFFPSRFGLAGPAHANVFAQELLQIMVTCACLAGTASSIREVVKERQIYLRERGAGLSIPGYLASKLALLGVVAIVQSVALVAIGVVGRVALPAHGLVLTSLPLLELMIATALLAVASMCLGLLVSAIAGTSELAMQSLVILTMAQVILSGGVLPLSGIKVLNLLSWIIPARWGMAAMASTVNLNLLNPPGSSTDLLWGHDAGSWLRDVVALLVLSALCTAATRRSLRSRDPRKRSLAAVNG
jgi:ABC transport system ATP-binding/permease protein